MGRQLRELDTRYWGGGASPTLGNAGKAACSATAPGFVLSLSPCTPLAAGPAAVETKLSIVGWANLADAALALPLLNSRLRALAPGAGELVRLFSGD